MKKILKFIDDNILLALSLFLLIFIPLYPKWPLFDALPGYNVRVRFEDFFILFTFFIWFIQVFRKKIILKEIPLYKPVVAYLIVGFLSTLSAIFITKTVTTEQYQIFKIFLHYFRRIEYYSLFFIFFSAIKNKEQIKYYLGVMIAAVSGATIYGFGQKYLYWPAYSTMNREFSKGITLYLTEHARVLSTFGGHYDLAAYIMITLTIIIALSFIVRKWWLKAALWFLALMEYWLLILTASRTSFVAFLAAVSVMFFFMMFKKGWLWAGVRWFSVIFISMSIMLTVGPMSERFEHILKLQDLKTKLNDAIKPPPSVNIELGEGLTFEQQLAIVASQSDAPPSTIKPGSGSTATISARPADVYEDPYIGEDPNRVGTPSAIHADYSENALKYGLSTGIRLDALWPRAINGFKTNPLLGSGYSTLVKTKVWEQTQAESTDNDYLRMLGETGLLGFFTFMLVIVIVLSILYKAFKKVDDPFYYAIFASGIGFVVGMLTNAIYLDVFESSKIAYTFWSLLGVMVGTALIMLKGKKTPKAEKVLEKTEAVKHAKPKRVKKTTKKK